MASRKNTSAIAFIDMHGEVDLRTPPCGDADRHRRPRP